MAQNPGVTRLQHIESIYMMLAHRKKCMLLNDGWSVDTDQKIVTVPKVYWMVCKIHIHADGSAKLIADSHEFDITADKIVYTCAQMPTTDTNTEKYVDDILTNIWVRIMARDDVGQYQILMQDDKAKTPNYAQIKKMHTLFMD